MMINKPQHPAGEPIPVQRPRIIAHAGCLGLSGTTLAYIEAGLAAGADGIEIDLNRTRDGIGVLAHDEMINDHQGLLMHLHQLDYDAAKTRQPALTTLDEVLAMVRDRQCLLNIDIKDLDVVSHAMDRLRAFDCLDLAYLTGIELADAEPVLADHPDARIYVNLRVQGRASLFNARLSQRAEKETRRCLEIGAVGVNLHWRLCSPAWIKLAHELGLPVSCWTVDRLAVMARVAGWHPDLMTTNEPGRLAEVFNRL
jgi:glycerophosphoryl diester phosphodiesterase